MADRAIAHVFQDDTNSLLTEWFNELPRVLKQADLTENLELRQQCHAFLTEAAQAIERDPDPQADAWVEVRQLLGRFADQRAKEGFSASEAIQFLLALKRPVFQHLRQQLPVGDRLLDAQWLVAHIFDQLALLISDRFVGSREAVIARQQDEMLELSTPVVTLWDRVLALPMIGTLDSGRAQVVTESLLSRIGETEAEIVIIDITGVSTVDTLVAGQLLKTVAAAQLMGVECIVSGIRPQIAQTIVQLGVELDGVTTKATLKDAFKHALDLLRVKDEQQARQQQQL